MSHRTLHRMSHRLSNRLFYRMFHRVPHRMFVTAAAVTTTPDGSWTLREATRTFAMWIFCTSRMAYGLWHRMHMTCGMVWHGMWPTAWHGMWPIGLCMACGTPCHRPGMAWRMADGTERCLECCFDRCIEHCTNIASAITANIASTVASNVAWTVASTVALTFASPGASNIASKVPSLNVQMNVPSNVPSIRSNVPSNVPSKLPSIIPSTVSSNTPPAGPFHCPFHRTFQTGIHSFCDGCVGAATNFHRLQIMEEGFRQQGRPMIKVATFVSLPQVRTVPSNVPSNVPSSLPQVCIARLGVRACSAAHGPMGLQYGMAYGLWQAVPCSTESLPSVPWHLPNACLHARMHTCPWTCLYTRLHARHRDDADDA